MKRLIIMAALAAAIAAAQTQAPGTVTVTATITATAGASGDATQVSCTGTPGVSGGVSTMHMVCAVGGKTVHTSDSAVPSAPGTGLVYTVTSGSNSVTWLLSKGNAIADSWQVSANGSMKQGSF